MVFVYVVAKWLDTHGQVVEAYLSREKAWQAVEHYNASYGDHQPYYVIVIELKG